jgi:hypothetical protein
MTDEQRQVRREMRETMRANLARGVQAQAAAPAGMPLSERQRAIRESLRSHGRALRHMQSFEQDIGQAAAPGLDPQARLLAEERLRDPRRIAAMRGRLAQAGLTRTRPGRRLDRALGGILKGTSQLDDVINAFSGVERIIGNRMRTVAPEALKQLNAAQRLRGQRALEEFTAPGGVASRVRQAAVVRSRLFGAATGTTLGFGLGGFGAGQSPAAQAAAARRQVTLGRMFSRAAQVGQLGEQAGLFEGARGGILGPQMQAFAGGQLSLQEMRRVASTTRRMASLRRRSLGRRGLAIPPELDQFITGLRSLQGYLGQLAEFSPKFTARMRRTVREGRRGIAGFQQRLRQGMGALTEAQVVGGGGGTTPIGGAGGRSLRSMMFGATDPTSTGAGAGAIFPGTGKRFRGFGTAVRTVAQFAGASAIIFAFANSIRDAITAGKQFESTFARIQGVLPTRSLVERITIEQTVIQAARDYSVDLLQAAESAKIFAQQGLRASEIARELGAAMLSVQAIGLAPQQAREALTAVRNITKVQEENASVQDLVFGRQVQSMEILDRIARIESRRAINASDLADALKQAAPLARQLRGEFVGLVDELDIVQGAVTQIVEQTRVSGRQAATSLRFILARLGRPQVIRQVEQIGQVRLATKESEGKQLRPLVQVLEELSDAYARIKKEQGSAEAIKFLVAVAGARQINAAAILLSSYKGTLDTARLGALAWGDAQERLAIQQRTFEAALTRLRTEVRAFGTGIVQTSGTALVLRSAIEGLTGALSLFGGAAEFTELKVAGLVLGFIGLFKVIRALRIGMMALATAPGIAAGVAGIAAFFTTPLGAIVALTAALTGLTVAAKIFSREKSAFKIDFIEPGEIKLADIPKAQQFFDLAERFETPVDELFAAFVEGSKETIKFLEETGNALQDTGTEAEKLARTSTRDFKLVRDNVENLSKTVVDDLFEAFSRPVGEGGIPKFVEELNNIIVKEGLNEIEANALRLQAVMTLLSDVAFISLSVLGQNIQRIGTQTESVVAQLSEGLRVASNVQAEVLRGPIQLREPILGAGFGVTYEDVDLSAQKIQLAKQLGGIEQVLRDFRAPVIDQVRVAFSNLDKGLQELIVSFISSEETSSAFAAALAGIAEAGEVVSLENFLARFNRGLQVTLSNAERRAEIVANIGERLITMYEAQDLEAGVRPLTHMFEAPVTALQSFATTLTGLIDEAAIYIQEKFGGLENAPQRVVQALELMKDATKVAVTDMARALARVSDPLNKLLVGFYAQERAIDANAAAAQRLGLAQTEVVDRLKNAQKFGRQLFAIEEQFVTKIINEALKIAETTPSGTSEAALRAAEELQLAGIQTEMVKALIQQGIGSTAAVERAATNIFVLAGRLKELGEGTEDIFEVFAKAPKEAADEINTFLRFYDEFLGLTEGMTEEELQADPKKLLEARAAGTRTLESLREAWDKIIEVRLRNFRLWEEETQRSKLVRDVTLEQLKLEQQLVTLRSQSLQEIATFGLRPLEKLGIEQSIQLEREADRFQLIKEEIVAQQIFNDLQYKSGRIEESAHIKRQADLNSRLIREGQFSEINRQRILEETTIRAIQQEQMDALNVVQSNYDARIAGLKQILTDFETISSGKFFEAFFGTPGKAFIERQADILIKELFDPTRGVFKNIGRQLGLAGETDRILVAHTEGSAIAAAAIVQAHIYGGSVAASLIQGQSPAQAAKNAKANIAAFASPEAQKAAQKQAIIQGLGTALGNLGGAAIGGGGTGAQIGSSFGTLAGTIGGTAVLTGAIGSLAGPVGAVVGGVIGGLIGGLFDKEEKQYEALQIISRNTGESVTLLENTNRLLDPNQVSFALPTSFRLPGFAPSLFGGQTAINNQINVNVAPGTTAEQGREIATVISQELDRQLGSGGMYVTKVGY